MSGVDDALDRLPMVPHVYDDAALTIHADPCWGCICEEAVAAVRSGLERLREERDAMREQNRAMNWHVRRLTEGLREIERMAGAAGYGETPAKPIAEKARALLSASPTDGGGAK